MVIWGTNTSPKGVNKERGGGNCTINTNQNAIENTKKVSFMGQGFRDKRGNLHGGHLRVEEALANH